MEKNRVVPKYLRVIIPLVLVVAWFALAGFGGPIFGKISEVASNDQSTFLPASAESTQVNDELKKFQDSKALPAIIVFNSGDRPLSTTDLSDIAKATQPLAELDATSEGVSPPIPSKDGKAAFVVANMQSDAEYKAYTKDINDALSKANLSVDYNVTGPVGFLNDLGGAFSGIDGLLLGVALAVVFVILLIVYRSPLLPFIVLINSMFALCAAILVVFLLAKADVIVLNGQVQGILFILVIGAATDYALLFIARYREELSRHKLPYQAILASWKRSVEPIVAAAGTVIAGLLCLLLSDLTSNKALGPVGAIGIAMAIIATLTLLPSLLLVFGRKAFWPRHVNYEKATASIEPPKNGLWGRTATFIARRARPIWITITILLVAFAVGITQLKADGVAQSEFVLGKSAARDGQQILDEHFPGGSGTPASIIIPQADAERAQAAINNDVGVASSTVYSKSATNPYQKAEPTVVDGEVLIEATLQDPVDSQEAQATVERLRNTLHEINASSRVGGAAAIQLDTRTSSDHDRAVVIPAVLVVITIILMLLLRSILAPLILLVTTMLSFAATLGVAALLFNGAFNFPGADPSVVLYGFIFLVALGIDYNIFLMTRVREESAKLGTRKGVLAGLVVTGSVITSAGIVLASTFAALAVIPILFLAQLAFIVAFGVLLDTIIVRSLLVPAIVQDLGGVVWWPSKRGKINL